MSELHACPFCGEKERLTATLYNRACVVCSGCGAMGPATAELVTATNGEAMLAEAGRLWNGRADIAFATSGKRVRKGKGEVAVSERGLRFADYFRGTLPGEMRLATGWREKWARVFDEMIERDRRTPEEIAKVCRWARAHDFWRGAFLSPAKLRVRKDGVQYFDRFAEQMRAGGSGGAAARKAAVAAGQYAIEEGHGPAALTAAELLGREVGA